MVLKNTVHGLLDTSLKKCEVNISKSMQYLKTWKSEQHLGINSA